MIATASTSLLNHIREIGGPLRPPVKTKKAPEVAVIVTVVEVIAVEVVPSAPSRQEQIDSYLDAVAANNGGLISLSLAMNSVGALGAELEALHLTHEERREIDRVVSSVPEDELSEVGQGSSRANALEYYGNGYFGKCRDKRSGYHGSPDRGHRSKRNAGRKRNQRALRAPLIDLLVTGEMPVCTLTVRKKYSGRQKYGYYA